MEKVWVCFISTALISRGGSYGKTFKYLMNVLLYGNKKMSNAKRKKLYVFIFNFSMHDVGCQTFPSKVLNVKNN